jgi:hypothetical protein
MPNTAVATVLRYSVHLRGILLAGYVVGLFWLNIYICRDLFFSEYTGHMNSMHGFWIAIARLRTLHWWEPGWWPYWDGGMPFEFTYAPLIPGLTALCAELGGCRRHGHCSQSPARFIVLHP